MRSITIPIAGKIMLMLGLSVPSLGKRHENGKGKKKKKRKKKNVIMIRQ